jgi:hypothetical protein
MNDNTTPIPALQKVSKNEEQSTIVSSSTTNLTKRSEVTAVVEVKQKAGLSCR